MTTNETPIDELLSSLPDQWQHDANSHDSEMLGVSIINWRNLTDADAPETWTQLANWVTWFLRRYEIPQRKIPTCWYKHGALVEELSALHTAWIAAFDRLDGGYGPIGWHERLNVALPRISTWYSGQCTDGHTDLPGITRTKPGTEWADWIRTSHAN
jgi:hypothetical protein